MARLTPEPLRFVDTFGFLAFPGMLAAVIGHWSKLGKSSPDALRSGFLARSGKLSFAPGEDWKLQVEQNALDILLNYLPWGIGVVRLPWLPGMLMVEWGF